MEFCDTREADGNVHKKQANLLVEILNYWNKTEALKTREENYCSPRKF